MAKRTKQPTKAEAEDFMYQVQVHGHIDLRGEWQGWRLRGRYLISPEGERITPQRLSGICFVEKLQQRTYRAMKRPAAQPQPLKRSPVAPIAQDNSPWLARVRAATGPM